MSQFIDWQNLKIKIEEIENILHLNFQQKLGLEMAISLDKSRFKPHSHLLAYEIIVALLSLFIFVTITFLVGEQWLSNLAQAKALAIAILISFGFSCLIFLGLHIYLRYLAKGLKPLAQNLNKITRYNSLLDHLKLLTEFNHLSDHNYVLASNDSTNIESALRLTRTSLLSSLQLEKFLLTNQKLQSPYRVQLLSNVEDELVQFMTTTETDLESQKFLTEIIQIGLSVHQQMRQTRAKNFIN